MMRQLGSENRTNVTFLDKESVVSDEFISKTSLENESSFSKIVQNDVSLVRRRIQSYSFKRAGEM